MWRDRVVISLLEYKFHLIVDLLHCQKDVEEGILFDKVSGVAM